jgi:hypothetical protein
MKAFLSICFAVMTLLSQIGWSVARHYCGTRLVNEQVGIVVHPKGCGMEQSQVKAAADCPGEALTKTHCCSNELTVFQLKEDYTPALAGLPLSAPVWVLLLLVFFPSFLVFPLSRVLPLAVVAANLRRKGRRWLSHICCWRI